MSEGERERQREEREEDLETRFSLSLSVWRRRRLLRRQGDGRGVFSLAGRLTLRATYNYRVTVGLHALGQQLELVISMYNMTNLLRFMDERQAERRQQKESTQKWNES